MLLVPLLPWREDKGRGRGVTCAVAASYSFFLKPAPPQPSAVAAASLAAAAYSPLNSRQRPASFPKPRRLPQPPHQL
uniref:Uncharacterized protein n=1 Tax=Oryza brachyantha TaxID=4533 RepID=J3LCB4_ORYBR